MQTLANSTKRAYTCDIDTNHLEKYTLFNIKSRTMYSFHVIRGHLQGFKPMTYVQFVKFSMFKI